MSTTTVPEVNPKATTLASDAQGSRRERPWLLPSNRKLRHLHGISLRNITLSNAPCRPRGKTIDDESIQNTWSSPAKILAQRETRKLEHSRSSSDLAGPRLTVPVEYNGGAVKESHLKPPPLGRLRRRSTLNWSDAAPESRQKRLEAVTGSKLADTWFSLHCEDMAEPVYISEVIDKAMNPSFRFFDLSVNGPIITRLDEVVLKFWAKNEIMQEYSLLVELRLNLRSLQFIGKSVRFVFEYFIMDMAPDEPAAPSAFGPPRAIAQEVQLTSSYDALMRLSTLDDCIQDALATREQLTSQISSILQENDESLSTIAEASQSQETLSQTKRYLASARKSLKAAMNTRSELKASLDARRAAMREGTQTQLRAKDYLDSSASKLAESRTLVSRDLEAIQGQQRRICEDLSLIYPIDPIPNKALAFTIRGLPLPSNSSFEDADEASTAAALGMVAHLVYLLSFYTFTPLSYPIQPYGSTSFIRDPISLMPGNRTFPLYIKGSVQYRFEYAVFLLNKDIELLMSRQGLKVLDIRHTLPNLKYLLYVLTAGTGELPARKAGGVRGLLAGRVTTGLLSRTSSADSATGLVGSELRRRLEEGSGDGGAMTTTSTTTSTTTGKAMGLLGGVSQNEWASFRMGRGGKFG
ncbi:MAG: hypothetical protein M1819_000426 [Sarea resinae]|nr:MAG: hypothetical protein M1819_000426 [Sarea resinae]